MVRQNKMSQHENDYLRNEWIFFAPNIAHVFATQLCNVLELKVDIQTFD